jgi:hypothetical protein
MCVLLSGLSVRIGAQQDEGFFGAPQADQVGDLGTARAQLRARAVSFNFGRLPQTASADAPARVTFNLFDDASFVALIDSVSHEGLDTTVYTGHVEGYYDSPTGADVNQVSLVVHQGVVEGSVVTPKGSYQITSNKEGQPLVREVDPAAYPEDQIIQPTDFLDELMNPAPEVMNDDGSRQDLMVLYTAAARAEQGGTANMQARITLGVTETNLAYARSGVVFRLRLRHMRETAYVELGASTDLSNLANGAGLLNVVPGLRNTYGADLVKLVTTNAGCGIAYLGGPAGSMAGQENRGYSVTENGCISPNYTFGHEIGHNQGNNHYPDDPVGTGAYSYSYGYRRCNSTPYFRSVMAYVCPSGATGTARSLNFSNPAVNEAGAPTGTNNPIGVSTAQNNAASMNNVRVSVANWRQQTQEFPITSLWPVLGDSRPGQVAQMWALVRNDTPYTATASQRVWFWTDGPGAGPGESWIGSAPLTGLAPGAQAWYPLNWTIPINAIAGDWVYWARVWDSSLSEYRSDWRGPQAFTVFSLTGAVVQTWPVTGASNGHVSTLWGRAQNTGNAAFPPNTWVYYWVQGPGINGYVDRVSAAGLAAGSTAWYGYNWFIPNAQAGGAYTYWAILWSYSADGGGWKQVSGWSPSQAFTVTYRQYWGEVTQTWPVSTTSGGTIARGLPGRYWGLGWNSGGVVHDANVYLWFYLVNPAGAGAYIGSVATTNQAVNTSVWRYRDHVIPAGAPLGTYTYYGIFWRWNGSSWVNIGPWSTGRSFGVASDQGITTDAADLPIMPLPDNIPPPPPLKQ